MNHIKNPGIFPFFLEHRIWQNNNQLKVFQVEDKYKQQQQQQNKALSLIRPM